MLDYVHVINFCIIIIIIIIFYPVICHLDDHILLGSSFYPKSKVTHCVHLQQKHKYKCFKITCFGAEVSDANRFYSKYETQTTRMP